MNKYRTHMINDLTESQVGEEIVVSGWVENIRDHGGVLFLDLRDETGTLQTVSNDDDMFKGIAKESVVRLSGTIRKRDEGTENDRITTGTIELLVDKLDMLGTSLHELPFEIMTSKQTKDDVRLKYRYLDLRNETVKSNIKLRAEILHFL
ncbi:MAG: Asp-tRNA(Asn)/Glu-tRNA(Gln) amidotransferase GatCAB subunit C, partial [Bacilli bacterium]|nr:Asp-tRNA(Asn)/Glu-tRNA(Gln) amidotransferase GatCAB subunit C [Bacilli bacterium]